MPIYTWHEVYDRGSPIKPGSITQGSGTTPSLMDVAGGKLVAISDDADGRINIEEYRREDNFVGTRTICSVPVFTENSLIAYDHRFIVEKTLVIKHRLTQFGPSRVLLESMCA